MVEPTRATSKTETDEPRLAKLLIDSALPTFMNSSKETDEPNRLTPKSASVAPKRLIDRRDNVEPITP